MPRGMLSVGHLLASAAYDQGRVAAAYMVGDENAKPVRSVPTGIYTIPEISSIGKNEQELTAEKVPYEVGQAFFKHWHVPKLLVSEVGIKDFIPSRNLRDLGYPLLW